MNHLHEIIPFTMNNNSFNESLCAKHSSKDFININLLTIHGSRYHDLPFTNEKTKAKKMVK